MCIIELNQNEVLSVCGGVSDPVYWYGLGGSLVGIVIGVKIIEPRTNFGVLLSGALAVAVAQGIANWVGCFVGFLIHDDVISPRETNPQKVPFRTFRS
jgi:hypothetical protein